MEGAKLLGQKLRDMGNLIPKIMSGTVVSDFADPGQTFITLDTAPDVPAPAQTLMGTWAKGTRVKCLAYPPRGLLILGSNEADSFVFTSAVMAHKAHTQTTDQATYNSAVGTLGTGTNGFTFVAPPSGAGTFACGGFGVVLVADVVGKFWGEIREGATIGSGTLVWNGDSDLGPEIRIEAESASNRFYVGSAPVLVTGLTPGATYNASGWYAVEAAGGVGAGVLMASRQLSFIPSP